MERNAREGYGANQGAGRWSIEHEDLGWWKEWNKDWLEALARHGRTREECPVSMFMNLFCTNDPERAWAQYKDGILHVKHAYDLLAQQPRLPKTPEDLPNWDKVFLTPDQMVALLREILDGAAPDHLQLWDNKPGMTYEDSYEFHKLFAEQVWPKIKDLA